jgi:hypothetical protein
LHDRLTRCPTRIGKQSHMKGQQTRECKSRANNLVLLSY